MIEVGRDVRDVDRLPGVVGCDTKTAVSASGEHAITSCDSNAKVLTPKR